MKIAAYLLTTLLSITVWVIIFKAVGLKVVLISLVIIILLGAFVVYWENKSEKEKIEMDLDDSEIYYSQQQYWIGRKEKV